MGHQKLLGLKVFMDAHDTVTVEEWGSLPPKAAKFCGKLSKRSMGKLVAQLTRYRTCHKFIIAG